MRVNHKLILLIIIKDNYRRVPKIELVASGKLSKSGKDVKGISPRFFEKLEYGRKMLTKISIKKY